MVRLLGEVTSVPKEMFYLTICGYGIMIVRQKVFEQSICKRGRFSLVKKKNKVNNSGTLVLFIMKFSKQKVVGKVLHILLLYQVGFVKIVSAKKRKRKIRKVNRCLVQAKLYQLERKICCYSKSGNTRCIICKMVVSCNGKLLTYQITLSLQNTV